jgi:hypothetical protein
MSLPPDAPIVAGGRRDPNLAVLVEAYRRLDIAVRPLLIDEDPPALLWDLERGQLSIGGEVVAPESLFLRHDVFATLEDPSPAAAFRAMAWTTTLIGWLRANQHVRTVNRTMWQAVTNKPETLLRARRLGFKVPNTIVTNDRATARTFLEGTPKIAKPVAGGDLARRLDDALARATPGAALSAPAIVQPELVPPEIRIYLAGGRMFAFEVRSKHLDYRAANDADVVALPTVPLELEIPLRLLAHDLDLDFCAADFKATPDGELLFLEVNSSPMFARFDQACDGRISTALVEHLCGRRGA